jgi:hypothetical protein
MGLRETAREAEQSQGAPGPVVAAAEQKALKRSISAAQDRHGVPDSHVYLPDEGAMADGRIYGQDAEKAIEVRPGVIEVGGLRVTAQQYAMLLRPIDGRRIKYKQKQSHLEAWDVRRHLIRIFGFGGFEIYIVGREKIHEKLTPPAEGRVTRWVGGEKRKVPNEDWMYTVVYDCVVRLVVHGLDGTSAVYEDAATGDGNNMPTYQAAADFAIKTAQSQALKRCAVNLGDQFGMSLYNGGSLDPVVNVTLIGPVIPSGDAVERAASSGEVHSEPEPMLETEGDPEDPGDLPSAIELRDEALDKGTTLTRLRQIYAMVNRKTGDHPSVGQTMIVNGTGDTEPLDYLIYNLIQERKTGGETE